MDGRIDTACFSNPQGVYVDEIGTIYVSDTGNSAVRMVKANQVTTLFQKDASKLVQYPIAPRGLLVQDGVLYVCDAYAKKVITIKL